MQVCAGRVRNDPCNDVLVVAAGPRRDIVAVLSNTGRVRWSASGPVGATAVRPAVANRVPITACR